MDRLPIIAGALAGSLAALTCVAFITGAASLAEIVAGAIVLAVLVVGLIIISEG